MVRSARLAPLLLLLVPVSGLAFEPDPDGLWETEDGVLTNAPGFDGVLVHPELDEDEIAPVVNGTVTHDWEQVVALVGYRPTDGAGYVFCSGTLIDRTWILTAAHCIQGGLGWGFELYVAFGGGNIFQSGNLTHFIKAEQSIPHPSYSSSTLANDIGLVELTEPITDIVPLVLSTESPGPAWAGEDHTFVGFGVTGDGMDDAGVKHYTELRYQDVDGHFLYFYTPGTNICNADSGGAGVRPTPEGPELAGVNSFGFATSGGGGICEGGGAGATRVDRHIDWISGYAEVRLDHDDPWGFDPDDIADLWTPPQRPAEGDYKRGPLGCGCATGPGPAGALGVLALLPLLGMRRRQQP